MSSSSPPENPINLGFRAKLLPAYYSSAASALIAAGARARWKSSLSLRRFLRRFGEDTSHARVRSPCERILIDCGVASMHESCCFFLHLAQGVHYVLCTYMKTRHYLSSPCSLMTASTSSTSSLLPMKMGERSCRPVGTRSSMGIFPVEAIPPAFSTMCAMGKHS